MTWQLFALIQTVVLAVGLVTALGLRNLRLRRRNDELLALCGHAHEELLNVTGKLSEIETTAPPEQMLGERVKALTGDDPVIMVRRLVLDNEISPKADFAARLAEHLASHQEEPPDEEEFAKRWRAIRAECHQLAMFLIADDPDCLTAIQQIFEVVEPLDRAYNIDLPPLELPSRSQAREEDAAAHGAEAEVTEGEASAVPDDDELLTGSPEPAARTG
jgi:hypothetical protein